MSVDPVRDRQASANQIACFCFPRCGRLNSCGLDPNIAPLRVASFERIRQLRVTAQKGMTDRIPPVSEAAAVPANQRHVLVSVLWFETLVSVPLSVVHNGLFGVWELCVLFLFCSPQSRLGSSSTSRTHTCGDLGASWRRVKMRLVKWQSA